jgi:hypothetical protein
VDEQRQIQYAIKVLKNHHLVPESADQLSTVAATNVVSVAALARRKPVNDKLQSVSIERWTLHQLPRTLKQSTSVSKSVDVH